MGQRCKRCKTELRDSTLGSSRRIGWRERCKSWHFEHASEEAVKSGKLCWVETLSVHICPRWWQPIQGTKACISSKHPLPAYTRTNMLVTCSTGLLVSSPWRPKDPGPCLDCQRQRSSRQSSTSPLRESSFLPTYFFPSYLHGVPHMKLGAELHAKILSPSLCNSGAVLVFDLLLPPAVLLQPCRLPHSE